MIDVVLFSFSGFQQAPFYGIQAKCINSKPVKGIRANIYKIASECQAYYNGSANQSIFYTGNDLNIVLLFADESHARGFLTRLDLIHADHIRFHNMITFETAVQQLPRPPAPQAVFYKHYQSTDETSPPCFISCRFSNCKISRYCRCR